MQVYCSNAKKNEPPTTHFLNVIIREFSNVLPEMHYWPFENISGEQDEQKKQEEQEQ